MIAEPFMLLFEFTFLQGYYDESLLKYFLKFRRMVTPSSSGPRNNIHGQIYPEGKDRTIFRNCLPHDIAYHIKRIDSDK
jgi:hypothetical protein